MHCMLMDLLDGFEVLSTTEETLFNSRNVSRLVQNKIIFFCAKLCLMCKATLVDGTVSCFYLLCLLKSCKYVPVDPVPLILAAYYVFEVVECG